MISIRAWNKPSAGAAEPLLFSLYFQIANGDGDDDDRLWTG